MCLSIDLRKAEEKTAVRWPAADSPDACKAGFTFKETACAGAGGRDGWAGKTGRTHDRALAEHRNRGFSARSGRNLQQQVGKEDGGGGKQFMAPTAFARLHGRRNFRV